MSGQRTQALVVGMPIADLRSATAQEHRGPIVLPAGGPGDLDRVGPGTSVLFIVTDSDGEAAPAATWRASLVERVAHDEGDPLPDGLPASWLARVPASEPSRPIPRTALEATDDDEDDDDEHDAGPQSFFEVTDLRELGKPDWVFANELVGKQARRGRTFFPRVPMLVSLPD